MQLISLHPRTTLLSPPHALPSCSGDPGPEDDPPPKGGLAIHLRDLRFDPPVIADAVPRLAA